MVFFLQQVLEGHQYYYHHISLTGDHGEVFLVRALETRTVGPVTVWVRFENGNEARVQTEHLHRTAPKSPEERRQSREARTQALTAHAHQQREKTRKRIQAKKEEKKAQERSLREEVKRKHLLAEKRRIDLEKREKARAQKRHLLAGKQRSRNSKVRRKQS